LPFCSRIRSAPRPASSPACSRVSAWLASSAIHWPSLRRPLGDRPLILLALAALLVGMIAFSALVGFMAGVAISIAV